MTLISALRSAVNILVDTGAWYALADASDRHHAAATACLSQIADKYQMVTTEAIMVEVWSLINSHLGRAAALKLWGTMRGTQTPILCLEPTDIEAAWRIVQGYADQDFSFTDATTFALMERMGLTRCFAFDHHFEIYRFGPKRERAFTRLP